MSGVFFDELGSALPTARSAWVRAAMESGSAELFAAPAGAGGARHLGPPAFPRPPPDAEQPAADDLLESWLRGQRVLVLLDLSVYECVNVLVRRMRMKPTRRSPLCAGCSTSDSPCITSLSHWRRELPAWRPQLPSPTPML